MDQSKFSITARAALHASGSKFYETILITRIDAEALEMARQPAVLIKHFGPKAKFRGGGQNKIETDHDGMTGQEAYDEIWAKKAKKGEYVDKMGVLLHGIYTNDHGVLKKTERSAYASEVLTLTSEIEGGRDLLDALEDHHIDAVSIGTIMQGLEIEIQNDDPTEEIIIEEPEPEVVRDEHWGSF